jgi:hypothetical protein
MKSALSWLEGWALILASFFVISVLMMVFFAR